MDWADFVVEVPGEEGVHQPRSLPHRTRPSFHPLMHKQSAQNLLLEALQTDGRVDFPTVTEICEGVADDAEEMDAVAQLLSRVLQQDAGEDSLLSLHLKALTVAHELLYDVNARRALVEAPGLLAAVRRLRLKHLHESQILPRDALRTVGGPAAECVRLLTSEICHALDKTTVCRL